MPKLELRRLQADLLYVYKMIHLKTANKFEDFFKYNRDSRTRGHNFKLLHQKHNTQYRAHFFSNRVINAWNSLSEGTVNSKTISTFKSNLLKENLIKFIKG